MRPRLRVATRGSALARRQTDIVVTRLGVDADVVVVTTTGDRRADTPIHALGGIGAFTKEVQDAVLEGRADIAVHSAKDLPSITPPGLVLAAVPERGDPRDALVGGDLDGLPTGARIGTGSVRRRAQLAYHRPDLTFGELRGNIGTRLERASSFDAIVVAAVALDRLGEASRVAQFLDPSVLLPQVAQGAIAVECRPDDERTRALVARIDDAAAHAAVTAERAFLAQLGGGCDVPCGALARVDDGNIVVDALLASLDGHMVLRARAAGADADAVGVEVARRLLDEHGGRALLEDVA